MRTEYQLGTELYKKLHKSIQYNHSKKSRDFYLFMEELPYKLKVELAMEIHKKIYKTVNFFQNKEKNFIVWIVTLLRPSFIQE
jgi:hypothetical protein